MSKVRDVTVVVADLSYPVKAEDIVKVVYNEFSTVFYGLNGSELRVQNNTIIFTRFGPNKEVAK